VTAASARIVAAVSTEASSTVHPTVCAVLSSVARPLLITVACVLFERPCVRIFLDAQLRLWVSLEHGFTCVFTTSQAERCSSTAHLLARWGHERTSPVVICTRRQSICYPYSWHPLEVQVPLKLNVNGLSLFKEDTGGPSKPVREFNLIACPLAQSS